MKPPQSSPLWPLCSRTTWHSHTSVLHFRPPGMLALDVVLHQLHIFSLIFSQFVFCKSVEDFGILDGGLLICRSCACAGSCRRAKECLLPTCLQTSSSNIDLNLTFSIFHFPFSISLPPAVMQHTHLTLQLIRRNSKCNCSIRLRESNICERLLLS